MAANSFYMSIINIITMMKQTGQNLCVLHMCFGTENSSHKLNPQTAELAKPGLLGFHSHLSLLQLSCVHYYVDGHFLREDTKGSPFLLISHHMP